MSKKLCVRAANEWFAADCLILDTETTGLDENAEIVEISIIDVTGQIVFSSLVRPTVSIPAEVTKIHGISDSDVIDAPSWADIHETVCRVIEGRKIVIYNADYDVRLMRQTAGRHGLTMPPIDAVCLMLMYAEFFGEPSSRGGYRWQRLSNAAAQCGVDVVGAHRATADCVMTLGILRTVAAAG